MGSQGSRRPADAGQAGPVVPIALPAEKKAAPRSRRRADTRLGPASTVFAGARRAGDTWLG
jgi:hypothetical protein